MSKTRLLCATLLLLLIPVVAGVTAVIFLRQPPGAAYDRCLFALPIEALANPGANSLIADLKLTSDYAAVTFNVNRPYQRSSINVLIPGDVRAWPSACPLVAEPADCEASAKDGYIVCNPGVGKRVASPLLNSGVANVQTFFALRFLILTVLGHELGHLRFGSGTAKHLLPTNTDAAMTCSKAGPSENTEEQKADLYGAGIACDAVRKRPELNLLPTQATDLLKIQSSLEDALDWEYFQMDDACVGDKQYPSVSRRKHTFSKTYLACLYPGKQFNPVAILAEKDATTFDDLERRLRNRQKFGVVSSGQFGRVTLYSERTVSDGRDGYLTFDSSGKDSSLWHAFPVSQRWQLRNIANWASVGNVVGTFHTGGHIQLWLDLDANKVERHRTLTLVQLDCAAKRPCTVTSKEAVPIPDGGRISMGNDGTALVLSPAAAFFIADRQALMRAPQAEPRLTQIGSPDHFISTAGPNFGVLVPADQGGILQTIVLDSTSAFQRQMIVTDNRADHIESMALTGQRWLFVLARRPTVGSAHVALWDCPATLLRNVPTAQNADCLVRAAPFDEDQSPALASRDLSSLFERRLDMQTCPGLLAVQMQGWLWLVDPKNHAQDLLPASGVVSCGTGYVDTYRTRRIDRQMTRFTPEQTESQTVISLPVN